MKHDSHADRSSALLDFALGHVPAYASWHAYDPGGADIDARFAAMPATTKRELREHFPHGFVAPGHSVEDGLAQGHIEHVSTSGTTSERVTNLWHQHWWDASERGSWSLNAHTRGITGTQHEALLGSPLSIGVMAESGTLPIERRRTGRFLFLNEVFNPADWTDAIIDRMVDELGVFKPVTFEANPSLLARFCLRAHARGRKVYQPRVIILTYEFPSQMHLRAARTVFSCPIASSHGSTEVGYVFMECEHGRLHQNTAFCRVDFIPWRSEFGDPALGRMLVSTFDNPWCVLLRFDIGDIGRRATAPCPCGRTDGLVLDAIEGRATNVTMSPAGMPVTERMIDLALSKVNGIQFYQLVETDSHAFTLRLVAVPRSRPERAAQRALERLYGPGARIAIERVARIEPSASGKFRLVIPRQPVDPASLTELRHS